MAGSMADGVQVLEFTLDDRRYCVDIAHVDEIVNRGELTPLPSSEPHVEGIMDLRGATTTIVNPKQVLDLDGDCRGERIIVFATEGEDRATGWIIDEVEEVHPVTDETVDRSVEGESMNGIVKRDDGFVIWVDPTTIND